MQNDEGAIMSRKRPNVTDADVERWIRQGFGQGEGGEYLPWAKVRDVPSIGRSSRLACLRSGRTHHFYSDVEVGHFLLADFRINVQEIREQVALLPREETIEIADDLGIPHPRFPGTTTPTVLTSDLLVSTTSNGAQSEFVLSVKRLSAIHPDAKGLRRTLQKLTLERTYWQRRKVPWYLVTEAQYDPIVIRNLGLLRPARQHWTSEERCLAARDLAAWAMSPTGRRRTLRQCLSHAEQGDDLAYQDFGLAVWKHWLPLNLSVPLRWDAPLILREVPR